MKSKPTTKKTAKKTGVKKPGENSTKRPPGRPSGYSEKIAEEIIEQLASGKTITSICKRPGMPSVTTFWRWEQDNEQLRKDSARAKSVGTHALASECLDIADDPLIDPANKRIMVDTRIRLIGKWNSREYGEKIDITAREEAPPVTREIMIDRLRRSPSFFAEIKSMIAEAEIKKT